MWFFCPFVANEDFIPELFRADALLFLYPPTGRVGVFSGKLFEYISTAKPIIAATVLNDVAAGLIMEYKVGHPVGFNDIEGIKRSFMEAASLWQNKVSLNVPVEKIHLLHRKNQWKNY